MINNDQQCTVKSTIILLPELSVYYLIPYRHESDIRRIFMKDYNAEKIFLTNFCMFDLKAFKLLALDNFAGGGGVY